MHRKSSGGNSVLNR